MVEVPSVDLPEIGEGIHTLVQVERADPVARHELSAFARHDDCLAVEQVPIALLDLTGPVEEDEFTFRVGILSIGTTGLDLRQLPEGPHRPPLGHSAHGRIDEPDALETREPELDEPLAVEVPRHLLQNLDPAQAVLDQVVVRREDTGDLALDFERADRDFGAPDRLGVYGWIGGSLDVRRQVVGESLIRDQVVEITFVNARPRSEHGEARRSHRVVRRFPSKPEGPQVRSDRSQQRVASSDDSPCAARCVDERKPLGPAQCAAADGRDIDVLDLRVGVVLGYGLRIDRN